MKTLFKNMVGVMLIATSLIACNVFAKVVTFPLKKDSTEQNPEAFFCTATKIESEYPGDIIDMSNFVQMIKGFGMDGRLSLSSEQLNRYYFLAYHDNTMPQFKDEPGYVSLSAGTFDFTCQEGTGDRELIPGMYGKARYSK